MVWTKRVNLEFMAQVIQSKTPLIIQIERLRGNALEYSCYSIL